MWLTFGHRDTTLSFTGSHSRTSPLSYSKKCQDIEHHIIVKANLWFVWSHKQLFWNIWGLLTPGKICLEGKGEETVEVWYRIVCVCSNFCCFYFCFCSFGMRSLSISTHTHTPWLLASLKLKEICLCLLGIKVPPCLARILYLNKIFLPLYRQTLTYKVIETIEVQIELQFTSPLE